MGHETPRPQSLDLTPADLIMGNGRAEARLHRDEQRRWIAARTAEGYDVQFMDTTYTQSEVELKALDVLAAQTATPVAAETVSDAVDIYLARSERENLGPIDRTAISTETADGVVSAVVECVLARVGD